MNLRRQLLASILALSMAIICAIPGFALNEETANPSQDISAVAEDRSLKVGSENSLENIEDKDSEDQDFEKSEERSPNYTGVAYYNYEGETAWWRFENGKVQPKASGIFRNEYGWWYVDEGKVDFTHTGVDRNEFGWWRVEDGQVNFNAKGVYQNEYGWWYVNEGKVDFSYTGVAGNEYGWWRIEAGKVNFKYNGLAKNEYGWWYLKNGKVQFGYTGIAQNSQGRWYVNKGKVDFQYDGKATYKGITYTCTDGKVTGGTNSAETNAVKVLNSVGWDFKKAYYWTTKNITYNKTVVPVDGSYGIINYANHGFVQKTGNCYTFSCCVYYLGRMANEDIHIIKGTVPYRSGGRGVHSWNEIIRNGKKYVLDAQYEQQWRNQGKQPYSGWLFTYGTKGSLVYAIDHQMD